MQKLVKQFLFDVNYDYQELINFTIKKIKQHQYLKILTELSAETIAYVSPAKTYYFKKI